MFLERSVRGASTGVAWPPLLTGCDAAVVDLHAEPKGSTPRPVGRSLLASELRQTSGEGGSKGRIRDQCMGLAGKRAERNLTEPAGVGFSVTNFISLPYPFWNTVSKGAAPAG